ncbi:MAG: contractile injection system protein, VgrG/Pvc8 family [Aliarcobacter sp.]
MVKPRFKVVVNGKDMTQTINQNASKISFHDEDGTSSDDIRLSVEGSFRRPAYGDEIKLWIGDENAMMFCGTFAVQNSKVSVSNGSKIEISATGVDFSSGTKVKRNKSYENISIKQVVTQIAKKQELKVECDYDDLYVVHIEQSNESDLHFLKRLASDYNALFAIKNNTLIFKQKVKGDKKSDGLPRYSLNIKDISSYDIENTNKQKYNSCTASWHDTKENKQKSVTVGDGEPVKHIKGSYQNEADAKSKAQAALQKASSQTKVGNISCAGFVCYAGGVLNLSGTVEDDGEYHIKSVNHDIDTTAGWKISMEIEN